MRRPRLGRTPSAGHRGRDHAPSRSTQALAGRRRAYEAARPSRRSFSLWATWTAPRRRRAMMALAERESSAALQAQALCREALVQMRQGDLRGAVASATAAAEGRHTSASRARGAEPLPLGRGALHGEPEGEPRACAEGDRALRALGDALARAAHWVIRSPLAKRSGRSRSAQRQEALELARRRRPVRGGQCAQRARDTNVDIASGCGIPAGARRVRGRGLRAGRAAHPEISVYLRRSGTLSACPPSAAATVGVQRSIGAWATAPMDAGICGMGAATPSLDAARRRRRVARPQRCAIMDSQLLFSMAGRLALREGDAPRLPPLRSCARKAHRSEPTSSSWRSPMPARAHLAAGDATAALAPRAGHRAAPRSSFAPLDSFNPSAIWWRHCQALPANGKSAKRGRRSTTPRIFCCTHRQPERRRAAPQLPQ